MFHIFKLNFSRGTVYLKCIILVTYFQKSPSDEGGEPALNL